MWLERLMWIGGTGFVIFGLLLGLTEEPRLKTLWGGFSTLSLGSFAVAMALNGIRRREIKLQFNLVKQSEQPMVFALVIGGILIAGLVVIGCAIWLWFFKAA